MVKKLYFWLSDIEYEAIKKTLMDYCAEKGCPLSNVLREALFEYIKKLESRKEERKKEEVEEL